MQNKTEKIQMWLACVLTAGEWGIAIYVLFVKGELVMVYLAVTYLLRETRGGKNYHEIVSAGLHKAVQRFV